MGRRSAWLGVALVVALAVAACGQSSSPPRAAPDKVESISGSPFKRVVLTPQGAQRIGVQTTAVRPARLSPGGRVGTVIPYAAVIYDNQGQAFAYTRTRPLEYVRRRIVIDRVAGSSVFLRSGPPAGTHVVTVGAEELYGAELGVTE